MTGTTSPTAAVRPHCAIRAQERYGINLSWRDVEALAIRCKRGEGHTETTRGGRQYHCLIHHDQVLWLVYLPRSRGSTHTHGTILTVMPPAVGDARGRRDYEFARRRRLGA